MHRWALLSVVHFKLMCTVLSLCQEAHNGNLQFHLVRQCQRSQQHAILWENTETLEECIELAKESRALAINYAPHARRQFLSTEKTNTPAFALKKEREHFLNQAEKFFNCLALDCPENPDFRGLVNDSRFDYFSLYAQPAGEHAYTCVPSVGLFQLYLTAQNYTQASEQCLQSQGMLAHVLSAERTNGLAKMLIDFNSQQILERNEIKPINLAYVGMSFKNSTYKTAENESIDCYLYRAWAPGYPKVGSSCVALTSQKTWKNVDCAMKLPYICEIYTSWVYPHFDDYQSGRTFSDSCQEYTF